MKRFAAISASCLLLLAATELRADMATPANPGGAGTSACSRYVQVADLDGPGLSDGSPMAASEVGLAGSAARVPFPVSSAQTAGKDARVLPPEPNSASLFLSALGTLGAWQMSRLPRKPQWGHLPEWYHPGGPNQIGHVLAVGPDCGTLAVCGLAHPEDPSLWSVPNCESLLLLVFQQRCLTSAAPRGPPYCS